MPTIQLENCTRCLKCVRDCPSDAINIELGTINNSCIHCGHCVAICPESAVFPDTDGILPLQSPNVSPLEFQRLSAAIRTCRSYLDREVGNDLLELLTGNMKHYPSASNARPVEITIVKTKGAIQRLNDLTAHTLIKTISAITSPLPRMVLKIVAPKIDVNRLHNYKKHYMARHTPGSSLICHHAPAVLLFHAPVSKYSMAGADAYIWSTYASIHANTLGLGTCFNGFIVKAMERSRALRDEFRIPPGHMVYAALLVGYPRVKYTNEAGRQKPGVTVI